MRMHWHTDECGHPCRKLAKPFLDAPISEGFEQSASSKINMCDSALKGDGFVRFSVAAIVLSFWSVTAAGSGSTTSGTTDQLRVVDLTPRFLDFYESAKSLQDGGERFLVWKEKYDFVALPPDLPDRDERARRMLTDAWPRYEEAIERIKAGPQRLEPESMLDGVASLLAVQDELPSISLLFYVGMFEGNAFFAPQPNDSLLVGLPVEGPEDELQVSLAHELFHAVHHSIRDDDSSLEDNVASLIISEGLAMWASRELVPGRETSVYTGGKIGWLEACKSSLQDILHGVRVNLQRSDRAFLNTLTVGNGVTGLNREAYCAGWHLVGKLLANGVSFSALARAERPAKLIERAISIWNTPANAPASRAMESGGIGGDRT